MIFKYFSFFWICCIEIFGGNFAKFEKTKKLLIEEKNDVFQAVDKSSLIFSGQYTNTLI